MKANIDTRGQQPQPRKYKKHTLLRRREAKKNNFKALDLPGKFAMIKRQKVPADAFRLWMELPKEDQLQFIRENYRGFKVEWKWRERQGLLLSPVKLVTLGFALDVYPKVGKIKFHLDLIQVKERFDDARTLATIQKYLPTVVAL